MRLPTTIAHGVFGAAAFAVASLALGQAQPNLLLNPSFESGATAWLVSGPAQVQEAEWAAGAGMRGVWVRGFNPGFASVSQAVTAPSAGDYVLLYKSKVEENYFAAADSLHVDLTGPASSVGRAYSAATRAAIGPTP